MKADKQTEKSKHKKTGQESVVISFRLSKAEYEPYRVAVEKSGVGRSAFFRNLFGANKGKVVITEKQAATEDYSQYLHLVGKISNNINQLARLLNGAEKAGKVTEKQYLTGLNNLNSIRLLLTAKLNRKE